MKLDHLAFSKRHLIYPETPSFGRVSRRERIIHHFLPTAYFFHRGSQHGQVNWYRAFRASWILLWPEAWPSPERLSIALYGRDVIPDAMLRERAKEPSRG